MKLLKPDFNRRIEIPGVPVPVRRPVDIDQSRTEFTNLRTLRIYQFDAGSVIDGHAEEDEVFIAVLAGSVELTMRLGDSAGSAVLTGADDANTSPCAAYLPPNGAYRMVVSDEADVAYVRATPKSGQAPRVFDRSVARESETVTVLFDESSYAEKLRLRLVQIDAREHEIEFPLLSEREGNCEALVHLGKVPAAKATLRGADSASLSIESWDSVAISPGENPNLHLAQGSSAQLLIALATKSKRIGT